MPPESQLVAGWRGVGRCPGLPPAWLQESSGRELPVKGEMEPRVIYWEPLQGL